MTARSILPSTITIALFLTACADDPSGDETAGGTAGDTALDTADDAPAETGTGSAGSADSADSAEPATCEDGPLTQWEQMMLDAHNQWRASVDPPAADMHRMYWDVEIAANAARWVSSCDPEWPHSPEPMRTGVGGYDVLGENLSYCAGTGCTEYPSITDGSGLGDGEGWWDERHDYTWEDDSSSDITSHYTQMVSSNVYAIGCATQECGAPGPFGWDGTWWWTICQYGPRGMAYWSGTKPYERGEGGLVEPPESVFEQHPGLCGAS